MNELKNLKDIKDIVAIPDNSLYILIALVVAVIIVAIVVALILKRKFRKRRRFIKSEAELAKERIDALDFSNTKEVVYTFIEDVSHFVNEANKADYEAILKELEPFKYKKEVGQISDELKREIKEFIKGIK